MELQRTMYYHPAPVLPATLLIVDYRCQPRVVPLRGDMTFGRIYQGPMCDITVQSAIVGRRHGEFVYDDSEGVYYYIDNNSLNGTFINGRKLEPFNERGSRAYRLTDGDILRVDRKTLDKPHPEAVIMITGGMTGLAVPDLFFRGDIPDRRRPAVLVPCAFDLRRRGRSAP